jgi:cellulose synthase/poly-beta-1,6-N-acetylglucosamine synthase-like glycosyltransferase
MLVVFLQKRRDILVRTEKITLPEYPAVTITVPAYNESRNIEKTVNSLLSLDYPKDKVFIIIVDDGSTDDTWEVMQQYKNHPQIKIYTKENGGKYTANNLGLLHSSTPFVGCLDADSEVHPEALKRIMTYFDTQEVMAVAPTILIKDPRTIIQRAQSVEYDYSIYVKKMLGMLNAIHVTPGPFSIFRKTVFETIGPYRHAHNTEDQEIALRMHENQMRIEHAPDAYVYTIGPHQVRGLYKQRVRWIYGFIKNAFDYKHLLFKSRYGNVGFITLPSGIISILSVLFLFSYAVYKIIRFAQSKLLHYQAIGFNGTLDFSLPKFDFFFAPSQTIFFMTLFVYGLVFTSLFIGQRMRYGKTKINLNIFYFFFLYSIIAPFWLARSIWNAIRSYEASWTAERDTRGV